MIGRRCRHCPKLRSVASSKPASNSRPDERLPDRIRVRPVGGRQVFGSDQLRNPGRREVKEYPDNASGPARPAAPHPFGWGRLLHVTSFHRSRRHVSRSCRGATRRPAVVGGIRLPLLYSWAPTLPLGDRSATPSIVTTSYPSFRCRATMRARRCSGVVWTTSPDTSTAARSP